MTIEAPTVIRQLNRPVSMTPAHQMRLWMQRPVVFFKDCFDFTLDSWQEEVAHLYMTSDRLGLIASKGPGKTCVIALLGWHFFLTKRTPKIAALSVTEGNLKANLWAELLMLRSRSKLAKASTKEGSEKITLLGHEGYSFIHARSYAKNADETTMSSVLAGLHADNVAFLIDEGGTIPDAIFSTADAALSTGNDGLRKCAKILVAANPERPTGVLYRASKGKTVQKWSIYHISGDPEDPKRAPRVSVDWAKEQIQTYGRDNPWVMINVLAQYPTVAVEALLSDEEIFEAMNRKIDEKEVRNSQLRLGVDVARGGIDNTTLAPRRGLKAYPIDELSSSMTGPEIAGKVMFKANEERVERVFVDNTGGYGSSVIDCLAFSPNLDVTPVVYNSRAQDKRYFNKRTEMWIRMRDWVRKGGQLPNDPRLAEELCMPKVYWTGGVMRLEEKEQIKARIGRSPDKADALAQTFADVEAPSYYANHGDPNSPVPGHAHEQQGRYYSDPEQVDERYRPNPNFKA